MYLQLPPVIEVFIKAKNNHDSETFSACFAENAIVRDEGRTIVGHTAIKKWMEDSTAKYNVALVAERFSENANEAVLTAQVSGNFEGSPVLLDYHFIIQAAKISQLDIRLTEE